MDEVVSIAPLAGEPGLIAYECPSCGYVTSVLFHPDGANSRAFLYRTAIFIIYRRPSVRLHQSRGFQGLVMTARMSMAEDRGAPVEAEGLSGLSSITMADGGRGVFPTDLLSLAAVLRGTCARPQNFAM